MAFDSPRLGDKNRIERHNEVTDDICISLKVVNLEQALERSGLRTRRLDSDGNVIRVWSPNGGRDVLSVVMASSDTARAVDAIRGELERQRRGPQVL